MSKPTLDQVELQSLKNNMDLLAARVRTLPRDSEERQHYASQIEPFARRYRAMTGCWYTYKHADRLQVEKVQ